MNVLITGASRGIGAAAARKFAENGHTVAVHCNTQTDRAEALAAELHGIAVQADFADFTQIDRMADEVLRQLGSVDVLVNNAGIALTALFQTVSDADGERIFRVNAGGTMHLTKKLLPQMIARKSGCIVNIASCWGEIGAACEVHYSASKAAVIGFTKALAKEVGPSGIRVNCISPGVIGTDMNAQHSAETMQALAEETPLCRIGTPEEVAEAVYFLATDAARFITGQILPVNGGFTV